MKPSSLLLIAIAPSLIIMGACRPHPTEEPAVMPTKPAQYAHTNRLAQSTSPYLLQHAHNPVDWYPWGEEAFEKARREDRPIFLSIGYSSCHWCHVMAHESFEDEAVAALLNEHFVAIKVDREERPDVDEIYMTAVQLLTGSGGWPLSVFLTPELEPFFGGTYFPPEDRWGRMGFTNLLVSISEAWRDRRDEVANSSTSLRRAVDEVLTRQHGASVGAPDLAAIHNGFADALASSYDATKGGFSGAPKFPHPAWVRFLLGMAQGDDGDSHARAMALHTLDRMAQGGMYDQVGGGFHRYSVDADWLVPHFEKMLYDNAQLTVAYLDGYLVTGQRRYRRVVEQTLDYVLRDMVTEGGGFCSAEDADSEGPHGSVEGIFYTWTPAELAAVLGAEEASWLGEFYGVTSAGNFEHRSILHLPRSLTEVAGKDEAAATALLARLDACRAQLLASRATRVRPLRDDKVLAAWNGLMIEAMARAAQVLDEPRYLAGAAAAGHFVWERMVVEGQLRRSFRGSVGVGAGFLDDYAAMINAYITLYESDFDPVWLERASQLADRLVVRFAAEGGGPFYQTTAAHEHLLVRSRPLQDGAVPSGNALACLALTRLAMLTGENRWRDGAEQVLPQLAAVAENTPLAVATGIRALMLFYGEAYEVALSEGDGQAELLQVVRQQLLPFLVVAVAPQENDSRGEQPALLEGRGPVAGQSAAYLCRQFACEAPVTSPDELAAKLLQWHMPGERP